MKKLIAALFATVLATAGLVFATSVPASANCTPSQYSGCVATKTKVKGPGAVAKGQKGTFCATVKAVGSTATPTGKVTIKIKKNAGGTVARKSFNYKGTAVCLKTPKLTKKGGYTVTANYRSPSSSVFQNSTGTKGFDVVG